MLYITYSVSKCSTLRLKCAHSNNHADCELSQPLSPAEEVCVYGFYPYMNVAKDILCDVSCMYDLAALLASVCHAMSSVAAHF